ncbi:MAG: hypothetical protein UW88_C0025G0003 [Candidatus Collierbacteria bacterium GW2011_GWD2_45_10]|uniref:Uncharacterized protein n=1 Tax=Candidatus Collierbacteria bacterium GW2011_GWB2_44_22 TaxID=1618387 RepID=A0A0G1HWF5_9BACT|nr:MAG: hypothetical protein UW44_C0020G0002 [Candidatus Collierbacteria bacterium GW2011_GWB2_44_22]KKT64236.1 MAG: hypothetical protein UW58_C0049G0002 [Candidatus Collierbacteria bacterium GW2011_GWC2_44_30]KKT87635.1 MAG: hypothetical protein UW88_C0025G0003 [Candidatus Collierbacteria bacterium GW2011_GWD2_45_10]
MYYFLFLVIVLIGYWFWTSKRKHAPKPQPVGSNSSASRYYEPPADMPKGWECCRYCGHVYDPATVRYEIPNPQALRQLLQGDCPKCGE